MSERWEINCCNHKISLVTWWFIMRGWSLESWGETIFRVHLVCDLAFLLAWSVGCGSSGGLGTVSGEEIANGHDLKDS